jgi:CcmD family protein
MHYLFAAFVATWVIHIVYLIFLNRGYAKVRQEIEELNESK